MASRARFSLINNNDDDDDDDNDNDNEMIMMMIIMYKFLIAPFPNDSMALHKKLNL